MQDIVFSPGMKLGIDLIDEQHAEFYALMNRLVEADAGQEHRDLVAGVIEELSDYVYTHFRTEEELLVKFGYEDFAEHHRQHAEFVGKVMEFHRQFRNGEIGLEEEMMAYLVDWFTDHIRQEDPRYVPLLQANGVL